MLRSVARARRPLLLLLTALALGLATLGLQAGVASGAPPHPVEIVVEGVSSSVEEPLGTPGDAVPYVLVEAGGDFSVKVKFLNVDGLPASFNKDTPLSISTNTGPDNQPTVKSGIAQAGSTTATVIASLPEAANQVVVTVAAPSTRGPHAVTPGTAGPEQDFDVLKELRVHPSPAKTPFTQGIGGIGDCTEATEADPVCGIALFPKGTNSPQVLLSLGACDESYAGCGSDIGSVVQVLADLEGLYEPASPAALIIRCDKSLCGEGPLQRTNLSYSFSGVDPITDVAPPCPAKNTLGVDADGVEQEACIDYVQSTRDNAGDSLLYLLFTKDARVSVR